MELDKIKRDRNGLTIQFGRLDPKHITIKDNKIVFSNEVLYDFHKAFEIEVTLTKLGCLSYDIDFSELFAALSNM